MRSVIGTDVAADPMTIFRLARGVERWPKLLPHYVAVRVERRTEAGVIARFVARRPLIPWLGIGLPVAWRSLVWSDPGSLQLRFLHLGGPTAGMDVTWTIEAVPGGCHVSIEHDFQPRFAPWAAVLDRLIVRPVAARTLASFKAIAEALSDLS
jgi:ribosome-associated toxin RatA of RatAB toxin-antitoxin module